MPLITPIKANVASKEAYNLLLAILALPNAPWTHRIHPYSSEQTKLITATLLHLQKLLDGSSLLNPEIITGPLPYETILSVFKHASNRHKTVLSFIYDDFNHDSPFVYHYRQMEASTNSITKCQVLGYDALLNKHGLDPTNSQNTTSIIILSEWYKENLSLLTFANYGSWEWAGFMDCHTFIEALMDCLNEHAILYGPNLLPTSYGMSIFDRLMRKRGIKLRLTDVEKEAARAFRHRIEQERHRSINPPFDVKLIGKVEEELTARAEYGKMMQDSFRGGCKL